MVSSRQKRLCILVDETKVCFGWLRHASTAHFDPSMSWPTVTPLRIVTFKSSCFATVPRFKEYPAMKCRYLGSSSAGADVRYQQLGGSIVLVQRQVV